MYNSEITFKSVVIDSKGKETTVTRDVFCRLQSIGMAEFYEAYAVGVKPEIRFIIPDYEEYENEATVIFNGTEYRVIRTYTNFETNELELTCESILNGGY